MWVYCITNLINNKKYVGITSKEDYYKRLGEHISMSKNKKYKHLICNKISQYGLDNFTFDILEKCNSINELKEKEIFWIDKLNTYVNNGFGYNRTLGGDFISDKSRAIGVATRIKNGSYNFSKEHRANLSKSRKNKNKGSANNMSRKITAFTMDGVKIKTFETARDACIYLNIGSAYKHIPEHCRGKRNHVRGYKFKYDN